MNDAEDSVDEPSTCSPPAPSFHDSVQENKHPSCVSEAECGISARFARFYVGFRIWVTGCPVFGRKGHMPEHRIGQHELHSHLRTIALVPVNVRDNTLQRSLCLHVRQSETLSSVHLRRHENQRTVSTDGPRVSLFFERQSNAGLPGDSDWDCHQYSLAPSAVCCQPGGLAGFGKPRFESPKLCRLNGGKHQPHTLASSRVDDSSPGFKQLCSLCDAYFCDRS